MYRKILPVLLALGGGLTALGPIAASAQCAPADLRGSLSAQERDAIAAEVAATPFGIGRAFEAVRDDQELLLFGTFHSAEAGAVPATIAEALSGASALLVEVTVEDSAGMQQRMQVEPGLILDMGGPGLKSSLPPEEWQELVGALQPFMGTPETVDMLQPWFAATLLALPMCEFIQQAGGAEPIDLVIQHEAAALGVPVFGLETVNEALGIFSDMDRDVQVDFLRMGLATADQSADVFMTMAQLYTEGRVAEIYALSNVLAARDLPSEQMDAMDDEVMGVLLTQRNLNWMPAILAAAENGPTVIAVGGLHLGGDDGLLRLLEAEGFAITRLVLDGEVSE